MLPLLAGERKENPDLRLGMFTQDLAQELDPEARAVDLVTAYAREGSDGDIFVSDQDARGAMGRLGLQGEKALRRICDLSGGEKARVALAMFSLKPSNVVSTRLLSLDSEVRPYCYRSFQLTSDSRHPAFQVFLGRTQQSFRY